MQSLQQPPFLVARGVQGRESRSSLIGGSSSESLEIAVKLLAGVVIIRKLDSDGTGGSTSKLTDVVVGRPWFLAGCWPEASFPCNVGLSVGCS